MSTRDLHTRFLVLDASGSLSAVEGNQGTTSASPALALSDALGSLHAELTGKMLAPGAIVERWTRIGALAAEALSCTTPFAIPSKGSSGDATRRSSALAPDERSVALRIRSDDFFAVRRTEGLASSQLYHELVKLVARVAPDLAAAPLGVAQMSAIAACLDDLSSRTAGPGAQPERCEKRRTAAGTLWGEGDEPALRRWRSGHHVFFLANQAANYSVQRAERALDANEANAAIRELDRATLHLRAMSAALWFASCMPPTLYVADVRSLMQSKSWPGHGFSGNDNYDNIVLAFAIEALRLRLMREPLPGLAAAAAARLFEAMVEHHENHVLVAAAMVGTATSLHRDADQAAAQVPAVDILRSAVIEATEQLEELRSAVGSSDEDR